jgi:hypothetical protein
MLTPRTPSITRRLVMLLAGAPLLVACGTATSPTEIAKSPQDAIEARADSIFEAIGGNATQKEAALWLEKRPNQIAFGECIRSQGFHVDSSYLPLWKGYRADGTSGQWMGALNRAPSERMLAIAETTLSERRQATPEQRTKEYKAASSLCNERTQDKQYHAGGAGPNAPAGAEQLAGPFFEMVSGVDRQLGSIEPYTDCMKREGIDHTSTTEGEQGWNGLYAYLLGKAPYPPLPDEEPNEAWQAYLSLEKRALEADVTCRETKYHEGLHKLAPLLDEYESEHGDQITEIREGWNQVVSRAEKQGFDPDA